MKKLFLKDIFGCYIENEYKIVEEIPMRAFSHLYLHIKFLKLPN
jgi:hypothetical protein